MSTDAKTGQRAQLDTPTDLERNAVRDIAGALNILLADMFALYMKTKNFHWHVSGPHFRDTISSWMSRGIRSSPRPTRLRNAFARSGVSHCDRLVTSVVCSECSTTRPSTSRPRTCLPSYATTTGNSRLTCARRTTSAMRRETWRPPVCLRSGSTRPSGVPGFCSKPAVGRRRVAEDASRQGTRPMS